MMGMVVCEVPTQAEVDAFEPPQALEALRKRLVATLGFEFATIVYSQEADPSTGLFTRMWVRDPKVGAAGDLLDPSDYALRLNERRSPPEHKDPPMKVINRSLNDPFQRWTRGYLSGQLAINDLDAIARVELSRRTTALLEIKRTRDNTPWTPYLKDVPNYMLVRAATRLRDDVIDLTLRYPRAVARPQLDLHVVTSISRDAIVGWTKHLEAESPDELVETLFEQLEGMIDRACVSRR
jgi:hypothetical protein